jgi:transposase
LKSITTLQQISSEVFWRCWSILNDATGLKKIYLAAGYTDLRRGIDGLATMIRFRFQLDPYDKNTLFLFCGKKTNRIQCLLWEGDGFLLLYKRLDNGAFSWPRSAEEALEISSEQYAMFMQGLEIIPKHPIRPNDNPKRLM